MSENIIIIGSSGAIGSGFVRYYENQNSSNVIYSLSRKEIEYSNVNIKNVYQDNEMIFQDLNSHRAIHL